jgi:tetratricopeptide (TPR) repeat protein
MTRRFQLLLALLLLDYAAAAAQVRSDAMPPTPLPAIAPQSSEALKKHYAALRLFAQARVQERGDRFLEALRLYEEALKVEQAASTYKALVPLCLALDRKTQALEYSAKAVAAAPDDFELRFRHGRLLIDHGKLHEAADEMTAAVKLPGADENPVNFVNMCLAAAAVREELQSPEDVRGMLLLAVAVLDDAHRFAGIEPEQLKRVHAESSKLHERLGRLALQRGKPEEAIAHLGTALQRDANRSAQVQFVLAEVYLSQGDKQKALEQIERYVGTQPGGTEAYEMLVRLLNELGRSKDILPALEKAAGRDPFNQALKRILAREYVSAGQADKGEQLHRALFDDDPSEQNYRGLAKLYQTQGRWNDLVTQLNDSAAAPDRASSTQAQLIVLARDGELLKGLAAAARALPQGGKALAPRTRRILTGLCRHAKRYDDAEHFCRLCLDDDGAREEATIELCRILNEARKPEALAVVCRDALTRPMKTPKLVFQTELARALALADKGDEAQAVCRDMLQEAKPGTEDHFRASITFATVLYRTSQLDRAVEELKKLDPKEPRHQRQGLYLLASVYNAKGELALSEAHLQKILDQDSEDATACNDLGYLWADQNKKLDEAERLIRKALLLDRAAQRIRRGPLEIPSDEADNAAYVDSLGWVLYRQGKLDEARKELERAAKLDGGEDPVIYDHLGDVYRDLKQLEEAQASWRKALQLYQTSKRIGRDDRRKQVEKKLSGLQSIP